MQKETSAFENLFSKTTGYLETRVELLKLKAIGKASDMASSFVSSLVVVLIAAMMIVLLNIGVALWLGSILGAMYLGFFAVTGFYLLLLLIFYLTRKQLLKTPLRDSIIKHFLN